MNDTENIRWWSSDGTVSADLIISEKGAAIYVFNSFYPGIGNARKALKELKRQYGVLTAHEVGQPTDPQWKFWMKMKNEGIISEMYDSHGNKV